MCLEKIHHFIKLVNILSYQMFWWWITERSHLIYLHAIKIVQLFATPWTVAHQAPQSMGFFRQEYWSGLPFPSPRDLPDPGIEPRSPALQADSLPSKPAGKPKTFEGIANFWFLIFSCWRIQNPGEWLQGWSWVSWRSEPTALLWLPSPAITRGHLPPAYLLP